MSKKVKYRLRAGHKDFSGFSGRVRQLRTERQVSQVDLGDAIGVRQTAISAYETGRTMPSMAVALRMAQFFGVPVTDLLQPDITEIETQ